MTHAALRFGSSLLLLLLVASAEACTFKRDLLTDSDADTSAGDASSGTAEQAPTTAGLDDTGAPPGTTTTDPDDTTGGVPPGWQPLVDGACVPLCVMDRGPETPVVDPDCAVFESTSDGVTAVPRCKSTVDGWVLPAGAAICHEYLLDRNGFMTPDDDDLLPPVCLAQGFNLGLFILRAGDAAPDAVIGAACEETDRADRDCEPLPEAVAIDDSGCIPFCAFDYNGTTPEADPACVVFETVPPGEPTPIPPCLAGPDSWIVPAGQDLCFAELVDRTGDLTPEGADDMDEACAASGLNLEIVVVRAAPAQPGATLSAACDPSPTPKFVCPDL